MTAQQRDIGSGWGPTGSTSRGPNTPAAAHAMSPGARRCAIILSPSTSRSSTTLGRRERGSHWVHSPPRKLRRGAPSDNPDGATKAWVCMTTGACQTPGPFLVSPSPPHSGRPPTAGRHLLVGGQLARRQVTPGKLGCGLPFRVHGTGVCSRFSPPVPGPHGGRSHTCRTPPAPLAASPTRPASEFVLAELAVSSWAWVSKPPLKKETCRQASPKTVGTFSRSFARAGSMTDACIQRNIEKIFIHGSNLAFLAAVTR